MTGFIDHTFNATGLSGQGTTNDGKVLDIKGSDSFSINAEISRDQGGAWSIVDTFTASTVQNFEWLGRDAVIRFNCTAFTTNPVRVVFK